MNQTNPAGRTGRRLALRRVLPLVAAMLAVGAAPAPAVAVPAGGDLVQRLAGQRAGTDWRTALRDQLSDLPAVGVVREVAGPVGGSVLAGTARLAPTIELTADTTILARRIVVSGGVLKVNTHGHALRLYPVASVGRDSAATSTTAVAAPRAAAAASGTITIDVSGAHGSPGPGGGLGFNGQPGSPGSTGWFGSPFACWGGDGGPGTDGQPGDSGTDGLEGGMGVGAGDITLDIPDGSTDRYVLRAAGGTGGIGGVGGRGGAGGAGGQGGEGGWGYTGSDAWDAPCEGGTGGSGGTGGDGGDGGTGGPGGRGGNGGTVTVTQPAVGYNPTWISVDVSAGPGGSGGNGGFLGTPGPGGPGGDGGQPGYLGSPGSNGPSGFGGRLGNTRSGASGSPGSAGTSSVTARSGGPFSVSPNPSSGSVLPGGSVNTTVQTATVSGNPQQVTFSATGLPADVNASFNPPSVVSGGSTTLTLAASTGTTPGVYQVTVVGTGATATVTAGYTLTVVGPPTGCSAVSDQDVTIPLPPDPRGVVSNIAISGCNIGSPMVATVEVHVAHTWRGSVGLSMLYPNGRAIGLKDVNSTDTAANINMTYRVIVAGMIFRNGTWGLFARSLYGGSGYIDSWRPPGPGEPAVDRIQVPSGRAALRQVSGRLGRVAQRRARSWQRRAVERPVAESPTIDGAYLSRTFRWGDA